VEANPLITFIRYVCLNAPKANIENHEVGYGKYIVFDIFSKGNANSMVFVKSFVLYRVLEGEDLFLC
jgi:hypothetical protein